MGGDRKRSSCAIDAEDRNVDPGFWNGTVAKMNAGKLPPREAAAAIVEHYRVELETYLEHRLRWATETGRVRKEEWGKWGVEDIVQEVYGKLARKFEREPTSKHRIAFLWRITTSELRDRLLRKRVHGPPKNLVSIDSAKGDAGGMNLEDLGADDPAMVAETQERLEKHLAALPDLEFRILYHVHLEQLTCAQIAARLRIEPARVRRLLTEVLRHLRERGTGSER